jgi:hypothetical protein
LPRNKRGHFNQKVWVDRRASQPSSSLEQDFCRQRLARQKRLEDDVSAQRPEIGDHHTREMAAKRAFLRASYQLAGFERLGGGGSSLAKRVSKAGTGNFSKITGQTGLSAN